MLGRFGARRVPKMLTEDHRNPCGYPANVRRIVLDEDFLEHLITGDEFIILLLSADETDDDLDNTNKSNPVLRREMRSETAFSS